MKLPFQGSVVIDNAYFMRVAVVPAEDDPPLIVDPYAVKPSQISSQRLQAIARRRGQVLKASSRVEHIELSEGRCHDIGREPPRRLAPASMEEGFRGPVTEGDNHAIALSVRILPLSRFPCNRVSLSSVTIASPPPTAPPPTTGRRSPPRTRPRTPRRNPGSGPGRCRGCSCRRRARKTPRSSHRTPWGGGKSAGTASRR